MQELQRLGYADVDILDGLNRLLQRRLIGADHMNFSAVKPDDSVRIHASGFMHVRVLVGRLEYLYGVIPTTAIFERDAAERVAEYLRQESIRTHIAAFQKAKAVEIFCDYLARQRTMNKTPFNENNGADYVLRHAKAAIQRFYNERGQEPAADPLDA